MRVGLQAGRDVEYSYDENQPYYLQSGSTASLAVRYERTSDLADRAYNGLRYGASLTYGR